MADADIRIVLGDASDLPAAGSIFGQKKWVEVLNAGLAGQIHVLKIYEEGRLAAYLPLYIVKKFGLSKAYLPPMTPYGGPYYIESLSHPDRNQFHKEKVYRRKLFKILLDYLETHFDYNLHRPEDVDVRQAQWQTWDTHSRYMLLADLRNYNPQTHPETLLSKRSLQDVKLAEEAKLSFEKNDADDFFCDGYNRIFERKSRTASCGAESVLAMRKKATELGIVDNFVVKNDQGKPLVYYSAFPDVVQKKVICWVISTLPEAESCHGSSYMYYKLLEYYAPDFDSIELGGADDTGVANFKEKFATSLIGYNDIEFYKNSFSKMVLQGYYRIHQFLRS